jgi:DNA-binding NarL/FixJ family response regulator
MPISQRQEHLYDSNAARRLRFDADEPAISADAAAPSPFPLARLWDDLMGGRWLVRKTWCCALRCHAELVASASATQPVVRREREFVERALIGDFEKSIAFDEGVSISTVANHIARVMRGWGLTGGVSYFPPLLTIAAHAHLGRTRNVLGFATGAAPGSSLLISAPRPDNTLPDFLSPSERSIVNRLVEGSTRDQIARERARSGRTVANQMAAVFVKFRVSGKRSLIARLVQDWTGGGLSLVST